MLNKLTMLGVYDKILTTCGYVVDDNGHVRKKLGKTLPVSLVVDGNTRYLVLPTKENLRSDKVKDYLFFHPFQENLVRGEPRILSTIRKELNKSYGTSVSLAMSTLVKISLNFTNLDELTVEQRDVISKIGKVDERFCNDFDNIIKNLHKRANNNTPVILSLRKGVKHKGKMHSRLAVWSSPLYDEVMDTIEQVSKNKNYTPKIINVQVRKSDLKTYENICKLFFKDIKSDDNDFYGSSDATDAPYTESFVRSLTTLPKHINGIVNLFYGGDDSIESEEVSKENIDCLCLDIDWLLELTKDKPFTVSDWRKEYLLIPLQDGNEGVAPLTNGKDVEVVDKSNANNNRWEAVTEESKGNPSKHQEKQPSTLLKDNNPPQEKKTNQFLSNNNSSSSNGFGLFNNDRNSNIQGANQYGNQFMRNNSSYGYNNYGRYSDGTHGYLPGQSQTVASNQSRLMRNYNQNGSIFGYKKQY